VQQIFEKYIRCGQTKICVCGVVHSSAGSTPACRRVGPGLESRPSTLGGLFPDQTSDEVKQRGPPYISAHPVWCHITIENGWKMGATTASYVLLGSVHRTEWCNNLFLLVLRWKWYLYTDLKSVMCLPACLSPIQAPLRQRFGNTLPKPQGGNLSQNLAEADHNPRWTKKMTKERELLQKKHGAAVKSPGARTSNQKPGKETPSSLNIWFQGRGRLLPLPGEVSRGVHRENGWYKSGQFRPAACNA